MFQQRCCSHCRIDPSDICEYWRSHWENTHTHLDMNSSVQSTSIRHIVEDFVIVMDHSSIVPSPV